MHTSCYNQKGCIPPLVWDTQLSSKHSNQTLFSGHEFSEPIKWQFLPCRESEDKSYLKYTSKNWHCLCPKICLKELVCSYKWPTDPWNNAQQHSASGEYKSKPEWDIILHLLYYQKANDNKWWVKMWRKGNPCAVLVGMKACTASMENSMEVPKK